MLCLNYHHRLIHFLYKKGYFLQLTAVTSQNKTTITFPPLEIQLAPIIFGMMAC